MLGQVPRITGGERVVIEENNGGINHPLVIAPCPRLLCVLPRDDIDAYMLVEDLESRVLKLEDREPIVERRERSIMQCVRRADDHAVAATAH